MLCKKCGAELPDSTVKCPFCGAQLAEEPPVEDVREEPEKEEDGSPEDETAQSETVYDENELKRREQIKKMMDEKQQQLTEIQERRESKRKKQKRKRILTCVLIAVIAAAAAGTTIYLVRNSSTDGVVTATISPIPSPTPDPNATPDAAATPEITAAPSESPSANPRETQEPAESSGGGGTNWKPSGSSGSSSGGRSSGSSSSGGASSSSGSGASSTSGGSGSSSGGSSSGASSGGAASSGGNASSSGSAPSSRASSYTGITKSSVNSRLAVGGEVIANSASGPLMTFVIDDTKYYAYVSPGSTTEQIKDKYMTINASPTNAVYNGNTIYDISVLTTYEGEYILKDSGTKLLTKADISGLSREKLALARNEIYARHGRKFQTPEYQRYFEGCAWYKENPNYNYADDNSNLNGIEAKNVEFLLTAENNM